MAVVPEQLQTSTERGAYPRISKVTKALAVQFADVAADVTYPVCTPLQKISGTGFYALWATGVQSGVIDAFVYPVDVELLDATAGETMAVVAFDGELNRDDIQTAIAAAGGTGGTNLDTALKARTLREAGYTIRGLAGV